jgi:hypothetical protein
VAVAAEAGPHGVVEDVLERRVEVRLVPHHPAAETLLEQVALSGPAAVEALGIRTAESMHAGRDPLPRRLDQQVEVRAHQAPGVNAPCEGPRDAPEEKPKALAVDVVEDDVSSRDAARGDVEDAVVREVRSGEAGHVKSTVARPARRR